MFSILGDDIATATDSIGRRVWSYRTVIQVRHTYVPCIPFSPTEQGSTLSDQKLSYTRPNSGDSTSRRSMSNAIVPLVYQSANGHVGS
jgi:hypothetical protein